jgi:hypothetical protein
MIVKMIQHYNTSVKLRMRISREDCPCIDPWQGKHFNELRNVYKTNITKVLYEEPLIRSAIACLLKRHLSGTELFLSYGAFIR